MYAGKYRDCKGANVIIITAGPDKPEQTRLDLIDHNVQICKSIVDSIQPRASAALLLAVTNPVERFDTVNISGPNVCSKKDDTIFYEKRYKTNVGPATDRGRCLLYHKVKRLGGQ